MVKVIDALYRKLEVEAAERGMKVGHGWKSGAHAGIWADLTSLP